MFRPFSLARAALLSLAAASVAAADEPLAPLAAPQSPTHWHQPVAPFRLADNTWYIGTAGLSALLIKGDAGAVVIDGGLPQAAPLLLQRIRELGVEPADVRLILHSHAHFDHSGPLAALKRATGAHVVSNAESAALLARGGSADLHFGEQFWYPAVQADRLVQDGETIALGTLRLTAHFTPGHTPGSLSWTWTDTRDGKPVRIAYVDSLTAPGYRLVGHPHYPRIAEDFRRTFATVRALPCDLLITPHPEASGWDAARGIATAPASCAQYADRARERFERQYAEQRAEAR
ncbi:MAG TPA: subclass B3 metallo-beta-lactamase [Lysobacter sp.]|nr:subclass B3 metallo-beta-lactamase [Lysobacter sp.]